MSNTERTNLDPPNRSPAKAAANKGIGGLLRETLGLGTDEEATAGIELDAAMNLLSNSRRRSVIRLVDQREAVKHGALAEQIAAAENDCAVAAVTGQQRKRVYIALYQTHLKKLSEAGVVSWDRASDVVSQTPETAAVAALLRDIDARTDGGVGR